jgi:large repetitive protein
MTVLVSVSSLLQTAFKVGANSRYEQEATEIASSTLDSQLATGYATLLTKTGFSSLTSVTVTGQVYLLEMEVAPYDPSSSVCVSPASDSGAMLEVYIWSTWTNQASGATWWVSGSSGSTDLLVEETSLLAVPSSAFNATEGSILVTVEGATGEAISDLSVTATPSSGSAETVTTTAGGCALFTNVAASPTTWTISFGSIAGYISEQEASTLPTQSTLSVTAATTTSVYMEPVGSVTPAYSGYDKEATVTPTYSVPVADSVHPILPTNISSLPLSFYSSNLTTSPYVSASPAEVFPMNNVPSYYVVAGSCGAESAPSGDTTNGQQINVAAGGTAAPNFTLVPVQIFVNQGGTLVSGASVSASVSNATGGTDTNCPATGAAVMPTLQLGSTTGTWSSYRRGRKHDSHPGAVLVSSCTSSCSTSTVMSATTSATYGSPVTFTATVSCTASGGGCSPVTSGTMTFTNKTTSTTMASGVTVTNGVATYVTSSLPVGSTQVTATYTGAGKWSSSAVSAAVTQTITVAPTTTTLGSSPNPNAYGTSAILTATVAAQSPSTATPTGTVTFTKAGVNISGCVSVTLSSGTATCTLSGLAGGSYSVAAAYTPVPTTDFSGSTSSTLTQQVTAASTTTVLTSSSTPNSASGQSVTFTATVTAASGGPAVGSVAFMDGATTLATVAVNGSGVATYATSSLAVGSHSMSAVFTATTPANFGSSTGTLTQGVNAGYTLCGLPYGVWLLSATYTNGGHTYVSSTESTQVVITVTPAGFSVYNTTTSSWGTVQAAGSAVVVNVQ